MERAGKRERQGGPKPEAWLEVTKVSGLLFLADQQVKLRGGLRTGLETWQSGLCQAWDMAGLLAWGPTTGHVRGHPWIAPTSSLHEGRGLLNMHSLLLPRVGSGLIRPAPTSAKTFSERGV